MAVSIKDGDYPENSGQNVPSSKKVQEQRIEANCFKSEKKNPNKPTITLKCRKPLTLLFHLHHFNFSPFTTPVVLILHCGYSTRHPNAVVAFIPVQGLLCSSCYSPAFGIFKISEARLFPVNSSFLHPTHSLPQCIICSIGTHSVGAYNCAMH